MTQGSKEAADDEDEDGERGGFAGSAGEEFDSERNVSISKERRGTDEGIVRWFERP